LCGALIFAYLPRVFCLDTASRCRRGCLAFASCGCGLRIRAAGFREARPLLGGRYYEVCDEVGCREIAGLDGWIDVSLTRMNDFKQSVAAALSLIGSADPELIASSGCRCGQPVGQRHRVADRAPLGCGWRSAVSRPAVLVVLANALLGLPPVGGLVLYLLFSRSGPLGFAGLLFTPTVMIMAQVILTTPIVVALVHRPMSILWAEYADLRPNRRPLHVRSMALLVALGTRLAAHRIPRRLRARHRRVGAIIVRRRQH